MTAPAFSLSMPLALTAKRRGGTAKFIFPRAKARG